MACLEAMVTPELVLVPGHAVCRTPDAPDLAADDAWALQPYQRGEGGCYVAHIVAGVRLVAEASHRWLVFSGGRTHAAYPALSEAESYRRVAQAQSWWGCSEAAARTLIEAFARDSYENLRFSLHCFHDTLGVRPVRVYVVGWRFKEQRFRLHAAVLGWPPERLHYIGVNDPPDLAAAQAGEAQTLQDFLADPHGACGRLAAKRAARNPFGDTPPAHWVTTLVPPAAL
ncbi:MAG: YdcF family protein [Chloracidobacterium sp.]|nr:YdcF family protein [Chloracidobacterium sp.]MDW8218551.1 ElyC/SanA/YdcF family protein [Acidobacteriota bacterium]